MAKGDASASGRGIQREAKLGPSEGDIVPRYVLICFKFTFFFGWGTRMVVRRESVHDGGGGR